MTLSDRLEAAIQALRKIIGSSSFVKKLLRCFRRVWLRSPFLHRAWILLRSRLLPTIRTTVLGFIVWLSYMLSPGLIIRLVQRNLQAFVVIFALFVLYSTGYGYFKRLAYTLREQIALAAGSSLYRRIRLLKEQMDKAESYSEWKACADEVDILKGKSRWKDNPESALYDWKRIQQMTDEIRKLNESKNVPEIMHYMRARLVRNIAGSGHPRLFGCLRAGTKRLLEEYQEEVVRALYLVALDHTQHISMRQKLAFFNETRHSMGRTALMLSGGAAFGCYHIGVVKALHDNRMLPKIISGSSAGSIVAAWIGSMTDEELDHISDPGRVNLDLFPPLSGAVFRKIYRLLHTGVIFDIRTLARCIRANIGDITFAEAYAKSGRIINITVAPANDSKEVARLLNYLTSPDVVMWSAAAASSAIPYFYEPVELLMKDKNGKIVPYYTKGVKWSDGSFHSDLPMQRLAELFNVNFYLVSQVNPHVIPFAIRKDYRLRSAPGILVQLLRYCVDQLRHNIMFLWKNSKLIAPILGRLTLIPTAFNQAYFGDVTIVPHARLQDYRRIVSNPSPEFITFSTRASEKLTWRKMAEIKNACDIEVALDSCVRIMRASLLMSNEVNVEQAASALGNKLASWAPEQFEVIQQAAADQELKASQNIPIRANSADTVLPPFGGRHHVPPHTAPRGPPPLSIVQLADNLLQVQGVTHHDQSEDVSDTYIP